MVYSFGVDKHQVRVLGGQSNRDCAGIIRLPAIHAHAA